MKAIVLVALLVIVSCATSKKPTPPTVIELPPVTVELPKPATVAQILLTASTSSCASVNWNQRGIAPKGYMKGMALVYARAYCKPNQIVAGALGAKDKDALAYYGVDASNRNSYAFLIGLGMRESSGKYCTGRDGSANNIASDTAESGVFQTSYDSRGAHVSLAPLFKNYSSQCYLDTFKEGVSGCSASDAKIWGTGADGLAFQKKVKECPAFAAEYAAITVRTLRKHYGPINRQEVQFKRECVDMLAEVEKIVDANPSICSEL